jgi:CheY-like chemotaxis protein
MPARCVLVIDREAELRSALEVLRMRGFHVERASDGREALELVAAPTSPVVLMDAHMPVMNGWEVIDALKRNITLRKIPVIAISDSRKIPNDVVSVPIPLQLDCLVAEVHRLTHASRERGADCPVAR